MTQQAHCGICWFSFPIDQFRVLRCGHCYCETCIEKLKVVKGATRKPTCPQCRAPICADDKRLYLSLLDPSEAIEKQTQHSVKMLNRLDEGTKTETVEHAGEYLGKVADNIKAQANSEGGVVETLLQAISDFQDRITPMYSTLSSQKTKIASQTTKLESILTDIKQFRHVERTYQDKLEAAEKAREHAINLAEEAKNRTVELREEVGKLEEERRKDRERIEESRKNEEEVKMYRDHCISYKRRESANKAKMKGLQDENKMLNRKLAQLQTQTRLGDVDESLLIGNQSYFILDDDNDEEDDKENAFLDFRESHIEEVHGSHRRLRQPKPSHSSLNRNPLASHPPARIRDDDDELDLDLDLDLDVEFEPHPPRIGFHSDWNLPDYNPNPKKRKAELEDVKFNPRLRKGGVGPLALDAKGHVKGTVQLAPRTRMGKRG